MVNGRIVVHGNLQQKHAFNALFKKYVGGNRGKDKRERVTIV